MWDNARVRVRSIAMSLRRRWKIFVTRYQRRRDFEVGIQADPPPLLLPRGEDDLENLAVLVDPFKSFDSGDRAASEIDPSALDAVGVKPIAGAKPNRRLLFKEIGDVLGRINAAKPRHSKIPCSPSLFANIDMRFARIDLLGGVGVGATEDTAVMPHPEWVRVRDLHVTRRTISLCLNFREDDGGVVTDGEFWTIVIRPASRYAMRATGFPWLPYRMDVTIGVFPTNRRGEMFRDVIGSADGFHWLTARLGSRYYEALDPSYALVVKAAIAVSLSYEWEWWFTVRDPAGGASVRIPTDPRTAAYLFSGRDLESGKSRRTAILHWVEGHQRANGSFVRPHLRGARAFSCNGWDVALSESLFDERSYEYRSLPRLRNRGEFLNERFPDRIREERRKWFDEHIAGCLPCRSERRILLARQSGDYSSQTNERVVREEEVHFRRHNPEVTLIDARDI